MASRGLRAFGFLLFSGALGGFCLSSGAAHYFPTAADRHDGGGGGQDSGGGGEGGGKAASQHGGIEQNGKGMPVAGAAGPTSGGKAAPEKTGPIEDGEDAPPAPSATVLTENEIVGFLGGNTIERTGQDQETLHRYMSRRGWQGDTDAGHLVAHRWIARANQLCLIGGGQSVSCAAVKIDRESKPGKEMGARLGTVAYDGGPAWPVLRGNIAHLPEVMPLIDGVRRLRKEAAPATVAAKGAAALAALVGRPLIQETREGEAVAGVFYDPDGRWVTTTPLTPGAGTGMGGVRVMIGQWSLRDGALCVDEPGLQLTRRCYAAEQTGETAFRLVPTQRGAPTALSVLAEGA